MIMDVTKSCTNYVTTTGLSRVRWEGIFMMDGALINSTTNTQTLTGHAIAWQPTMIHCEFTFRRNFTQLSRIIFTIFYCQQPTLSLVNLRCCWSQIKSSRKEEDYYAICHKLHLHFFHVSDIQLLISLSHLFFFQLISFSSISHYWFHFASFDRLWSREILKKNCFTFQWDYEHTRLRRRIEPQRKDD